jgi:hypothetical protein
MSDWFRLAPIVLAHTPLYVWLLLATAMLVAARRLKPRRRHLAVAAIPAALFLSWGLYSAATSNADPLAKAGLWSVCFALGAASSSVRLVPRPTRVEGFTFDFAPTALPMLAYLGLFCIHYALGIWAGFAPERSPSLSLAGLCVSALTAGRTTADFLALLSQGLGRATADQPGFVESERSGAASAAAPDAV